MLGRPTRRKVGASSRHPQCEISQVLQSGPVRKTFQRHLWALNQRKGGQADVDKLMSQVDDFVLNFYHNREHLTPFMLAADRGKWVMFSHQVFRERKLLWPWGPMKCFEIDLARIDSALPKSKPRKWVVWHMLRWLLKGCTITPLKPQPTVLDIIIDKVLAAPSPV